MLVQGIGTAKMKYLFLDGLTENIAGHFLCLVQQLYFYFFVRFWVCRFEFICYAFGTFILNTLFTMKYVTESELW